MSKGGVSRISVSVSPKLLAEFDEAIKRAGYEDRSKGVHVAMRNFITEYKWMHKIEGAGTGAIVVVYDHSVKGLEEVLTDVQHHHEEVVKSSMHIHLDGRNCLVIIAVKGKAEEVRDLAKELMSKRGVKQLKLTVVKGAD